MSSLKVSNHRNGIHDKEQLCSAVKVQCKLRAVIACGMKKILHLLLFTLEELHLNPEGRRTTSCRSETWTLFVSLWGFLSHCQEPPSLSLHSLQVSSFFSSLLFVLFCCAVVKKKQEYNHQYFLNEKSATLSQNILIINKAYDIIINLATDS